MSDEKPVILFVDDDPDYRDAVRALLEAEGLRMVEAATAAERSADLALTQYREGATDYTTVLTAQQALLAQQDSLAQEQGNVPQGLIAVYRALGGGWEIREGKEFLPAEVIEAMGKRAGWGGLSRPAAVEPPTTVQLLTPDW